MKPLHRRRLALGTVMLLALMGFLLLLWKMGSGRQGAEVLTEESASLRSGQPLLGRISESGARSESYAQLRISLGPVAECDPWRKNDPYIRVLARTIDEVVPEAFFILCSWIAEDVTIDMGIQPTWVAEDQVQWDCQLFRTPPQHDPIIFVDSASVKKGLGNGELLDRRPARVTYYTTVRRRKNTDATKKGDWAALPSLSASGKDEILSEQRLLAPSGMDVIFKTSEAMEGWLLGARVVVKAEKVEGGTALRGEAILRYASKQR